MAPPFPITPCCFISALKLILPQRSAAHTDLILSSVMQSLTIYPLRLVSAAQILPAAFFTKRKAAISSCVIRIIQSTPSFFFFFVIFLSLSLLLLFMLILMSVVMLVDVFTLFWLMAESSELYHLPSADD